MHLGTLPRKQRNELEGGGAGNGDENVELAIPRQYIQQLTYGNTLTNSPLCCPQVSGTQAFIDDTYELME